ncbi:MAG: hypothetical protein NXY57DRAFT_1021743 [Lentinula lateritia]|nr:MAG: hypothetical protein NXY57DRAFT_1021743 [Lentinula lateritia]
MSSNNINNLPLPYGWVEQRSPDGHRFYVDTKANPPRSIWTHPYEDEQYLHEHPDVREKMRTSISNQELRSSRSDHKQSNYDDRDTRRHSYNGQSSSSSRSPGHNRGFFGKLKDKAIGTKEERQAEKARAAQVRRIFPLTQYRLIHNHAHHLFHYRFKSRDVNSALRSSRLTTIRLNMLPLPNNMAIVTADMAVHMEAVASVD